MSFFKIQISLLFSSGEIYYGAFYYASNRYNTFRKVYVLEEFSSQEEFWLDMTNSIQVRILVKGGSIRILNLNEISQKS